MNTYLFTSESVTEGHPDKIADQISDAVLDAILKEDPSGRVACETLVTTGLVLVAGEISTSTYVDIPQIARDVIQEIGYTDANYGFDYHACAVLTAIDEHRPDIAMGVDTGGAGDQGMMFGYACDETETLMPLSIHLAHRLTERLATVRKDGTLSYLRPDGKAQVTVEYDADTRDPLAVHTVVMSTQHDPDVDQEQIKSDLLKHVIQPVCGDYLTEKTILHINPTGQFIIGGPPGDCGLTGRKVIVDTYGGVGRHGGGCFSGKDPSKVDRSAAYMARYIAKNLVAADLAKRCEVQFAYAIGVVDPVYVHVDTFGTGTLPSSKLVELVRQHFDLTPKGIMEHLQLHRPLYRSTAAYGHFGRELPDFTWEKTDKVTDLTA